MAWEEKVEKHIVTQIYLTLMSREVKERTILDTFAEDFVDVVEKHAKYIIVQPDFAI